MTKRLWMIPGLVAALTIGGVAIAGPGGGQLRRAMTQLDLTEEQQTEVQAVFEEAKENRSDTRAELQAIGEQFKAELASDHPNASLLHDLVDQKTTIQTEIAHARIDDRLEVHAILTTEQRAELAEMMSERRERGRRGHRQRGERGEQGEQGEQGDFVR